MQLSDNFERASLGANWTVAGGTPQIYGSTELGGGSTPSNSLTWNANDLATADQFMEVELSAVGAAGDSIWLTTRLNGTTFNGYAAKFSTGGAIDIMVLNAGVPTTLASGTATLAAGSILRFESIGSVHRVRVNGSIVLSFTDTTYNVAGDAPNVNIYNAGAIPTIRAASWRAEDYTETQRTLPFQSCVFLGSGSTGHALRLTLPGTYTLSNLTWTGFGANGSNFAAIYNDSGGLIILNVSGGTVPTVRNGSGASTSVVASSQVTVTSLVTGSRVKVLKTSDLSVLYNALESAGQVSFTTDYQGEVRIEARKASGSPYYQSWYTIATIGTGLTVTALQVRDDL